ncbi:hypothetical protein LY78DRAFT_65018 [Colletotrichum sublineola]|nr:hypothetical protein LY78DRAFT_65018 [Colletotrichum sublineola]
MKQRKQSSGVARYSQQPPTGQFFSFAISRFTKQMTKRTSLLLLFAPWVFLPADIRFSHPPAKALSTCLSYPGMGLQSWLFGVPRSPYPSYHLISPPDFYLRSNTQRPSTYQTKPHLDLGLLPTNKENRSGSKHPVPWPQKKEEKKKGPLHSPSLRKVSAADVTAESEVGVKG